MPKTLSERITASESGGYGMRTPKDPVRAQIVKNAPPAPPGMKKHYDPERRAVQYVPKTPRELLREGLRRGGR